MPDIIMMQRQRRVTSGESIDSVVFPADASYEKDRLFESTHRPQVCKHV